MMTLRLNCRIKPPLLAIEGHLGRQSPTMKEIKGQSLTERDTQGQSLTGREAVDTLSLNVNLREWLGDWETERMKEFEGLREGRWVRGRGRFTQRWEAESRGRTECCYFLSWKRSNRVPLVCVAGEIPVAVWPQFLTDSIFTMDPDRSLSSSSPHTTRAKHHINWTLVHQDHAGVQLLAVYEYIFLFSSVNYPNLK